MAQKEDLVHGWVSTDCGRGTSDILWSCLATMLLCVWTVIHLPLPCCSRFENGRIVPGKSERSWRVWVISSGIVPAVVSVIAPEYLTISALGELYKAWHGNRKLRTEMNWTLAHVFFLRAGGFCLETPSGLRKQLGDEDIKNAISTSSAPDWLSKLQAVKDTDIGDHAKSNPLAKIIACGQTVWLVTQVLTRLYQHQAVTLLEVSTTAYAACALTAYVAWWKKPQNATVPITLHHSTEELPDENTKYPMYYSKQNVAEYSWAGQHWSSRFGGNRMDVLIILCTAIFGAVHLASWNIRLFSSVEQWLWRASAIYCCTAALTNVLALWLSFYCEDWFKIQETTADKIGELAVTITIFLYVIVRLFMIFEVFFSLRALPRSAYEEVQWSSFIPHI